MTKKYFIEEILTPFILLVLLTLTMGAILVTGTDKSLEYECSKLERQAQEYYHFYLTNAEFDRCIDLMDYSEDDFELVDNVLMLTDRARINSN